MSKPCPCCDVERRGMGQLNAMAFGAALGCAMGGLHEVTELVCSKHRSAWVIAMIHASPMVDTADSTIEVE